MGGSSLQAKLAARDQVRYNTFPSKYRLYTDIENIADNEIGFAATKRTSQYTNSYARELVFIPMQQTARKGPVNWGYSLLHIAYPPHRYPLPPSPSPLTARAHRQTKGRARGAKVSSEPPRQGRQQRLRPAARRPRRGRGKRGEGHRDSAAAAARPHGRGQPAPEGRRAPARVPAGRARPQAGAHRGPGRVHERGEVLAPERARAGEARSPCWRCCRGR